MEAKDLRIGNYVVDKFGKTFQIKELHYKKTVKRKPIPLTEEWLIKFGFDKEEDYYVSVLGYDFGEIKIYPSPNGFFFQEGVIQQHIKYVHKLQNLYFALTNKELTIK